MRLILHIGMGKTGTSSIQRTLNENQELLANQKAAYLGMWFNSIDPSFRGYEGQARFFRSEDATKRDYARQFVRILEHKRTLEGTELFILSNEALFGQVLALRPFVEELSGQIDLGIIAYVRDPHLWLPSAFTQWGLRHKEQAGPLQPFSQRARVLIGQYEGLRYWLQDFRDIMDVRKHDTSINVVEDFAAACGIELAAGEKRYLERSEPAETMLRAAFNARFDAPILPDRFNHVVLNTNREIPAIDSLLELCFKHDGIDEIVEEKRDLFEFIRDTLGEEFDFLAGSGSAKDMPDVEMLRQRLLDYLLETVLSQSLRLRHLERLMSEMQKDQ